MSEIFSIDLIKNLQVHQIWWDDSLKEPVNILDENLPGEVETDIEIKGEWTPIKTDRVDYRKKVVIVDGVRRIDAHLILGNTGKSALLGEFVVGAFNLEEGKVVKRINECVIILPSEIDIKEPLTIGKAEYIPLSTNNTSDEGLYSSFIQRMREKEREMAYEFSRNGYTVIADGPLQVPFSEVGVTVGFVKSIRRSYLNESYWSVVLRLKKGERTPIFIIRTSENLPPKYSWYLRLKEPKYFESPFFGLVRLEAPYTLKLEEVQELAQFSGGFLPYIISSSTLSSRAPENLAPLESLERRLRTMFHPIDHIRATLRKMIAQAYKEV
ncbi:MAG: hypothetical protein N2380_10360 [bacterium]|nr:hypothetical protein [bacterium]